MITIEDLQEAIAECQGQRNPNANTCIKLAAFYTILNQLQDQKKESLSENQPKVPEQKTVDGAVYIDSESEFAQAVNGMRIADFLPIVDELMQTVQVVNPRLYDAVMRKL